MELKKLKRTGFFPTVIGGALVGASIPICNMLIRTDLYTNMSGSPIKILLDANWQLMALVNLLITIICACFIYNLEFTDNAIQKLEMLPIKLSTIFTKKIFLMLLSMTLVIAIEFLAIYFCSYYWFSIPNDFLIEIIKWAGLSLLFLLPVIVIMTAISSACKNIWISLGIGIICVFIAMAIQSSFEIFPFVLPFKIAIDLEKTKLVNFIIASISESILFYICELAYLKVRRNLS